MRRSLPLLATFAIALSCNAQQLQKFPTIPLNAGLYLMKNTLIPLSVAFMDETGKIINIEEMKEQTLDSHCAVKPASYALEMNKEWFKQKNIKPGTVIEGLPR
jgi:uncharacterized membrane protein (UPF0127 family)